MISGPQAARFDALWHRRAASPPATAAADVRADLYRRLGGSDRRFHNLAHISDCLHRFDEVESMLVDRDAVGDGRLAPAVASPAAPLRLALRQQPRQARAPYHDRPVAPCRKSATGWVNRAVKKTTDDTPARSTALTTASALARSSANGLSSNR